MAAGPHTIITQLLATEPDRLVSQTQQALRFAKGFDCGRIIDRDWQNLNELSDPDLIRTYLTQMEPKYRWMGTAQEHEVYAMYRAFCFDGEEYKSAAGLAWDMTRGACAVPTLAALGYKVHLEVPVG